MPRPPGQSTATAMPNHVHIAWSVCRRLGEDPDSPPDGSNYRDDSKTIDEDADGSNYRDDTKGISEVADGSNYRKPTS